MIMGGTRGRSAERRAGGDSAFRDAEEVDDAVLESMALEEIAEVARRYIPQLPEGSATREALIRLERLAPPDRRPVASEGPPEPHRVDGARARRRSG